MKRSLSKMLQRVFHRSRLRDRRVPALDVSLALSSPALVSRRALRRTTHFSRQGADAPSFLSASVFVLTGGSAGAVFVDDDAPIDEQLLVPVDDSRTFPRVGSLRGVPNRAGLLRVCTLVVTGSTHAIASLAIIRSPCAGVVDGSWRDKWSRALGRKGSPVRRVTLVGRRLRA